MSAGHQQIIIEEQGLRDGLQTLPITIPVETKTRWIQQFIDGGIKRLQVVSFVHPSLVPQMADAETVIALLPDIDDVIFSGLALNLKGVQRAANTKLKHLAISLSASNTHSLKNANKTISDAKNEFRQMVQLALQNNITIRGGIQCAFGCRYEGRVDEQAVYDLVKHHLDCGVHEIALADSTGMGHPTQIKEMMHQIANLCASVPVALHLHNTENKGYANLIAALDAGITHFDTAFGGLGGCPFIKGATGNIATEDTVHMLRQMGYEININIKKISALSEEMEALLGSALPGLMYKLMNRTDIEMN